MWDAAGGNLCLAYHGQVIFHGTLTGGQAQLTNTVELVRGVEQRLILSGTGLTLSALARGSEQLLAAETPGAAQQQFPMVRTSHGMSSNLRNNAVYDRKWDWQLVIEIGAVRITPRNENAESREFAFCVSGERIELVFRPRFYQQHKGIAFFEPWNYTVREDSIAGWNSWYAYLDNCTQQNFDELIAVWKEKCLADFGYRLIQIDEGYENEKERGQARPQYPDGELTRRFPSHGPETWLEWRKDSFPAGMHGFVAACQDAGFASGIWVGAHITDNEVIRRHPEWFVRDETGCPFAGQWIVGAVDTTNDEAVRALVQPTFEGIRKAGFSYVKIDLLRHYLYDNLHHNLDYCRERGVTPALMFRGYLEAVRTELGKDTFVLSCWGVLPESVGLVDACRIGGDGYGPASMQCYNSWNGIVWRNDPDAFHLYPLMKPAESGNVVNFVENTPSINDTVIRPGLASIAGTMLLLADKPEVFEDDRIIEGAKRSSPVLFSVPGQLYDYNDVKSATFLSQTREVITYGGDLAPCDANQYDGEVCPWWLNEFNIAGVGHWSVLHRVNWDGISPAITVAFADIGLEVSTDYLVYEFWIGTFLGIKRGRLELPKADALELRSYALRPLKTHPQIVSSNRHLSQGAADLQVVNWRNATLSGISRVVKDDRYELAIYVPAGYKLKSAEFAGTPAKTVMEGKLLRASYLPAATGVAQWHLEFDMKE
jgi:hypothetical protein